MESTLSLPKHKIEGAIGDFLGWGMGADNAETAWDTRKAARIEILRASGERQFYYPAPITGESYDWSFLRPTLSLTLASGASVVALPDDFGGIEGQIAVVVSGSSGLLPLDLRNDGAISLAYAANPTMTGQPMLAAVQPLKGTSPTASNRQQLYVYPTADQAYTLRFTYFIHPDALTGTRPYAYGGAVHAETVLASCVSAAEFWQDGIRGPCFEYFQERLRTSISMDRRLKPQLLGRNRDRSDGSFWDRRDMNLPGVTVNGVQY